MSKPYVTTAILIHGNVDPIELTDYVDNNGRFVPLGTQAAAEIGRGDAVHAVTAEGTEFIIPYHAIESVQFTKATDDYTKPEDTYCVADPCVAAGNCNTSYTVKFYNGEDLMQETIYKAGETPEYTGLAPQKEGYTFLGWNTDSSAATALETLPAVEATTTYYAIFESASSEAVVGDAIVGTSEVGGE